MSECLTFRCAACGQLSAFMFRVTPIAQGLRDLRARGEFRCSRCGGTSLEGPLPEAQTLDNTIRLTIAT